LVSVSPPARFEGSKSATFFLDGLFLNSTYFLPNVQAASCTYTHATSPCPYRTPPHSAPMYMPPHNAAKRMPPPRAPTHTTCHHTRTPLQKHVGHHSIALNTHTYGFSPANATTRTCCVAVFVLIGPPTRSFQGLWVGGNQKMASPVEILFGYL